MRVVRKMIAIIKLIILFFKELVLSSLAVAREVLRPTLNLRPGIVAVPTQLRTNFELTLFACLITLTPGTLSLEFSPEGDVLFVHCINIDDVEGAIAGMKNTFEKAILEVSRP